jgi:hypothetical protein
MKSRNTLNPPIEVHGNGTSLWGNSNGTFTVDSVSVDYINWESYPKNAATDRIHCSVTMEGPTTDGNIYTDKSVEFWLSKNNRLKGVVRKIVEGRLAQAGIKRKLPAFCFSWSEYGMQGEKFWNFDLCPLTKKQTCV